jgi:hypothetical protein
MQPLIPVRAACWWLFTKKDHPYFVFMADSRASVADEN